MYKVTYSFKQGDPRGGFPQWEQLSKLYDSDLKADELQEKIDQFLSDDCHGYRKNISVEKIQRI